MTEGRIRERVRERLGWPAEPATHRRIRRLWQRHSIAEDRRDIDGLVSTLAPDCLYEIVGTGLRWEGHGGARAFYTELFAAFPDNRFALTDIVIGPQGVCEEARLTHGAVTLLVGEEEAADSSKDTALTAVLSGRTDLVGA